MSKKKIWFITGSSSGLGRALAEEVLARGDMVIATARKPEVLQDMMERFPATARALKLDVTSAEQAEAAIGEARRLFGKLDVVLNNAGYGLVGAIEEATDDQVKKQFDTNVFGVLNVTRAALPVLREQGAGHIVIIGSMVGFASPPSFGYYSATKFALEGLAEALASEVSPLGIETTIVEPGAFNTGYSSRGALVYAENRLPEAYPSTEAMTQGFNHVDSKAVGDPAKAARIIVAAVNSEHPPFRLPVGPDAYELIEAKLDRVRQEIETWREVASDTQFDLASGSR